MIIISARKDFNNPDKLSTTGHLIKNIDLSNDQDMGDMTLNDLVEVTQNSNSLILVHGYNNEQLEVHDAYQVIEEKINNILPGVYDNIIGYSWPGGDHGYEWWHGKKRANSVARMFRSLLQTISNDANNVDIMSHSLGARVTLKALKKCDQTDIIRNYYCTAPAVDNECLEPKEEFFHSVSSCNRLFVFHSSKDGVLNMTYRAAEWDRALGLSGPEDTDYISRRARKIYVVNCKKHVKNHGGYKKSDNVYQYINKYQDSNPSKFKTL